MGWRHVRWCKQRYDEQFKIIIQAIQALTAPQVRERDPVGFRP